MTTLRAQLRRFTAGGILLREVRGIRQELQALTTAVTAIAAQLQRRNDHDYGQVIQINQALPPVEVTYADSVYQQRIADIVGRFTQAKGMIPSDDEAFEEYLRAYPDSPEAQEMGRELQGLSDLGGTPS